jgi:hypothetical protein
MSILMIVILSVCIFAVMANLWILWIVVKLYTEILKLKHIKGE